MSVVLAGWGHNVTGIDLSPEMIAQAVKKASQASLQILFKVMEASRPQFADQRFNGIVCRHLLWSLPNPKDVLQNWVNLLQPGGQLLLIEGSWGTGSGVGLHSEEIIAAFPASLQNVSVENLSRNANFGEKK